MALFHFVQIVMQKYKDIILVATGSFSPISTGHIRLMEVAYEKLKT